MRFIIILCLFFAIGPSQAFADSDDIITGDIILTRENISNAFKIEIPPWIKALNKEIFSNHYEYLSGQPSLEVLRVSKSGNCVAFAKLGAWHASQAGYDCKLISFVHGKGGHMFLYASRGKSHWVVSNKFSQSADSINDAILKMNAFGCRIVSEISVNFQTINGHIGSTLINEPPTNSIEPEGRTITGFPTKFINIDSRKDEYNLEPAN